MRIYCKTFGSQIVTHLRYRTNQGEFEATDENTMGPYRFLFYYSRFLHKNFANRCVILLLVSFPFTVLFCFLSDKPPASFCRLPEKPFRFGVILIVLVLISICFRYICFYNYSIKRPDCKEKGGFLWKLSLLPSSSPLLFCSVFLRKA